MYFKWLILITLFSSCALLKSHDLRTEKVEKLLDSIKTSGDGRGRLTLDQSQFVFGFEAILKENFDWLLAAEFPLHGEELLILKDLKSESMLEVQSDLQQRVEIGLKNYLKKNKKSPILADKFFGELHFLMQFLQSSNLGINRTCNKESEGQYICLVHDRKFLVEIRHDAIAISRPLSAGFELKVIAENRQNSVFQRLNISFYSQSQINSKSPLMGLELFWK